jgi:ABC-type multidrug transport system fused ATPase/permease subunit
MKAMKWLDTLFAWLLVLLGIGHFLSLWVARLAFLRGPWAPAAAVAIINVGLMNAVRAQRSDRLLRSMTLAATLLASGVVFTILYRFPGNILHQPVALGAAALIVAEVLFALAG